MGNLKWGDIVRLGQYPAVYLSDEGRGNHVLIYYKGQAGEFFARKFEKIGDDEFCWIEDFPQRRIFKLDLCAGLACQLAECIGVKFDGERGAS